MLKDLFILTDWSIEKLLIIYSSSFILVKAPFIYHNEKGQSSIKKKKGEMFAFVLVQM